MNDREKTTILNIDELNEVSGGNYEGPIPRDQVYEKGELLDWILKTYGEEDAICAAGGFYYDPIAIMIFKKHGGKAWADFVYNHYDPNAGVVQVVIDD